MASITMTIHKNKKLVSFDYDLQNQDSIPYTGIIFGKDADIYIPTEDGAHTKKDLYINQNSITLGSDLGVSTGEKSLRIPANSDIHIFQNQQPVDPIIFTVDRDAQFFGFNYNGTLEDYSSIDENGIRGIAIGSGDVWYELSENDAIKLGLDELKNISGFDINNMNLD